MFLKQSHGLTIMPTIYRTEGPGLPNTLNQKLEKAVAVPNSLQEMFSDNFGDSGKFLLDFSGSLNAIPVKVGPFSETFQ